MVMGAWPMPFVAMLLQYAARATVTFPGTLDRTRSARCKYIRDERL